MADFDPFENQGGPLAWDPDHAGDARKQTDELLRRLAATADEPGSGPSTYVEEEHRDPDRAEAEDEDASAPE